MRIAATETQIDSYHAHVGNGKASYQCNRILKMIQASKRDWSIGEISRELQMEKSTVSARVNELLYVTKDLIEAPKRKDRVSGIKIRPVKAKPVQEELFNG